MEHETIEDWKPERPDAKAGGESVCLWLVHVETGRFLNEAGQYCGTVRYYEFESAEAAADRKDKLLSTLPFASVHIGRPDDPRSAKFNSPKIGEFTREKRRWISWKSLGFFKRWRHTAPTLKVFDPVKDPSVNP